MKCQHPFSREKENISVFLLLEIAKRAQLVLVSCILNQIHSGQNPKTRNSLVDADLGGQD